jgi:hypothetical protein
MMSGDRCDFQVPAAGPDWYGIIAGDAAGNILHQAAYWNGRDWAEYPVGLRPNLPHKRGRHEWAASQPE